MTGDGLRGRIPAAEEEPKTIITVMVMTVQVLSKTCIGLGGVSSP